MPFGSARTVRSTPSSSITFIFLPFPAPATPDKFSYFVDRILPDLTGSENIVHTIRPHGKKSGDVRKCGINEFGYLNICSSHPAAPDLVPRSLSLRGGSNSRIVYRDTFTFSAAEFLQMQVGSHRGKAPVPQKQFSSYLAARALRFHSDTAYLSIRFRSAPEPIRFLHFENTNQSPA